MHFVTLVPNSNSGDYELVHQFLQFFLSTINIKIKRHSKCSILFKSTSCEKNFFLSSKLKDETQVNIPIIFKGLISSVGNYTGVLRCSIDNC